jgi:Alginate export
MTALGGARAVAAPPQRSTAGGSSPAHRDRVRIRAAVLYLFLLEVLPVHAQPCQAAGPVVSDRTYGLLRDNENWSFLRDPSLRQDFWDPVKYVPLRNHRNGWYLSIGGEVRQALERVANDNWGEQPFWNTFFLQRYMVHFDVHYGRHFRSFVQLKSGIETFRRGGPRPIDEKRLDFEAAYLDICAATERNWIAFRAGRQELNYGSGRLVSVREGPNVRQSFDGFKVLSKVGAWHIDGFAVRPDLDNFGYFDNAPDHQTAFWGIYSTRPLRRQVSVDIYYLGLARQDATFNRGTANELRHTIGARLWRPIAQKVRGWDFDYEGIWQFGSFGSAGIWAWGFASETGYRLPDVPLKPRFSLRSDISSGDDPGSNALGTFNGLFPAGNYFGILQDTGPGPINFMDVHPRVESVFPHGVAVVTDLLLYWRQSLHDGVYSVPAALIRPSGNSLARFVGYMPGIEVRWQIDRHAYLQSDYGIFYAGRFLRETMPGRNLNYLSFWAGYKF